MPTQGLAYDGAVIKLYAAFERMIMGALTGAINNDTYQLSVSTSVQFPKHLTDEVCESSSSEAATSISRVAMD